VARSKGTFTFILAVVGALILCTLTLAQHRKQERERPIPSNPAPVSTAVKFADCDEVKKAGAAPLHQGEPGYRKNLDRDGDGVACDE
jgi:hypothetical protein